MSGRYGAIEGNTVFGVICGGRGFSRYQVFLL